MERLEVIYAGRVQGVGFRATARSIALGFDVTGWVRNEGDGTVRLQAQGAVDQVEALLDAIRARLGAGVTSESRSDLALVADEQAFRITH